MEQTKLIVEATVACNIATAWDKWTNPEHIINWNFASDEWHCPRADNDLRTGGKFSSRMEAKDGSFGFDFEGVYDEVIPFKKISYSLEDKRRVEILFEDMGDTVKITEAFDPETINPIEMQKAGWQAIMNNYKKYAEFKK